MSTETAIDLSRFVAKENSNYAVAYPFIVNGWQYATDTRICIRVPAVGAVDSTPTEEGQKFPPAEKLFLSRNDWQPWPNEGEVKGVGNCLMCEGRGAINVTICTKCHGNGEYECSKCGSDVDCPNCDSDGFTGGEECPACKGVKQVKRVLRQVICGVTFNHDYIHKIKSFANLAFSPSSIDGLTRPIQFRFDGGEGVLMPMLADK